MTGKPTTPISSPTSHRKTGEPTTPPSEKKSSASNRFSGFLSTPDQRLEHHHLPYTPSLKRDSSDKAAGSSVSAAAAGSPEYKLNGQTGQSPNYSHNVLKTPRYSNGYDSDDEENGASSRYKVQKTPTYFSPGRKLFAEEGADGKKEDLNEITLQLKGKLSSAINKLNKQQKSNITKSPYKFNFTELKLDTSPTRKINSSIEKNLLNDLSKDLSKDLDNEDSIKRANYNLQHLTNTTGKNNSPNGHPSPGLGIKSGSLQGSPSIVEKPQRESLIRLPSPDEESSAHNALMATLSRQQHQTHHNSHPKSPGKSPGKSSANPKLSPLKSTKTSKSESKYKLPPINIALNEKDYPVGAGPSTPHQGSTFPYGHSRTHSSQISPKAPNGPHNEQDAVYSLMSLSSPQSVKFSHSRTQSLNNNSPVSSRSSSVALSDNQAKHQSLPPITGLMHGHLGPRTDSMDLDNQDQSDTDHDRDTTNNDETDIEDDATDEETK